MKMNENLKSLCRLCAEMHPIDTLIKMHSEKFTNLSLAEKIYQYFIVTINENDILPKDICNCCCKRVLETYEFHKQIQKAQETLQIKVEMVEITHEKIGYEIKAEDNHSNDFIFDHSPIVDSEDKPLSVRLIGNKTTRVRRNKKELSNKSRRKLKNTTENTPKINKIKSELNGGTDNKISRKNSKEKIFICDQCGKCWKNRGELYSHLKSHDEERPFKCDECSRGFKTFRSLKRHKLIHAGVKPHECKTCGKKFRLLEMLVVHSTIHTGELPHECSYCKKKFRHKNFLRVTFLILFC
ncbi:zinc finger protein 479-like isoform X2 [Chrysoperla carnea]|uniref:zinc finger protein 479-like isoform X2 n=1 Tax=Chrysoperla carnea TaxID=189513 RepID=UPI001D08AEEC|nr:zinc finger protein 479-like isoform X2 [Chrysoperla carnea]